MMKNILPITENVIFIFQCQHDSKYIYHATAPKAFQVPSFHHQQHFIHCSKQKISNNSLYKCEQNMA